MPVAIAAGGFVELADALAALAAALLIGTLVVGSINWVAGLVSNIPVIGGALAGMLHSLSNAINASIQQLGWLRDQAFATASFAWNFLVGGTVQALFAGYLWWVQDWASHSAAVNNVLYWWGYVSNFALNVLPARITGIGNDLAGLHYWLDHSLLPAIQGIGNDLAGLHWWIDRVQMPIIRGIGDDLAGLHNWIDRVQMPGIDAGIRSVSDAVRGVEADVQTRARESDFQQALKRIAQLESQVAALSALGVLAALGSEAIDNLKEDALDPCRCVELANLGTLVSRVAALEVEA